jgi:hypothetical protein
MILKAKPPPRTAPAHRSTKSRPTRRTAICFSDPERKARAVAKDPSLLPDILTGLGAEKAHIKFGWLRVLRLLSEEHPELLYPHFDFFVRLLDHQNKIFQWNATLVLAELVRVDSENKFERIFDRYFASVCGPVMITAANIIRGAARIAATKPPLAPAIASKILQVENASYQTPECRNVAIGHAIVALREIVPLLHDQKSAIEFVERQRQNPRDSTRKKAESFLRQLKRRN